MSLYGKMRVSWALSENSDYEGARNESDLDEYTPDETIDSTVDALVAGNTVELGNLTTITAVLVINKDSTNFVTVGWTSVAGSLAQEIALPAGAWIKIMDVDPAADLTLTADTAVCSCRVVVWGT